MQIFSLIVNLIVSLKEVILSGLIYYTGKSKGKQEEINKSLKKTQVLNEEYIKNAEEIARKSDSSVFNELRSNWSRTTDKTDTKD